MEPIPALEVNEVASTRRSTSSSWAWAWRAHRPSSRHGSRGRTSWPSNGMRHPGGRPRTPAGSSTWEAALPSRPPAASRTRRRTWRPSSGPPSGPVRTRIGSTPTARVRADHFDWLVSIGVPFRAAFCDEPNRESADDAGLLFSGGEDSYPFDEFAGSGAAWAQASVRRRRRWLPHGAPRRRRVEPAGPACRRSPRRGAGRRRGRRRRCLCADRRRAPRRPGARWGDPGHGWLHLQRGDGRRALPAGPCSRPRLAHRHPGRRRPGHPHGRRRRSGGGQARRLRVRAAPRSAPPPGPRHPRQPPRRALHQRGHLHRPHRAAMPSATRTASST